MPERSSLWRTQNFLASASVIEPILDRSGIHAGDLVLDIGAGTGAITEAVAARGGRVLAVERDPALCEVLQRRFGGRRDVHVACGDFLRMPLPTVSPYKVFANPPFDVITAIVTKLTGARDLPQDVFLAMQREAAERFRGRPTQTLYALLLLPWFAASVVHRFRRDDFRPAPAVDVVMLRLRKRDPPLLGASERAHYRDFVVACFSSGRPSVGEALTRAIGARSARVLIHGVDLDPTERLSGTGLSTWLELFRAFAEAPSAMQRRIGGAERRLRAQQSRLRKVHRTRAPRDDPPHSRGRLCNTHGDP